MTTVSHFRALKVQQAAQTSLVRSIHVLPWSPPVTPKSISGPDSDINFDSCGFEVQPTVQTLAAISLIPLRTAEPGAWTDGSFYSTNSFEEGGMA